MKNYNLALIPSPPRGVWFLGNIPIRAYALCILVGILIAMWWTSKRWIERGGKPGQVEAVAIWAVPFGIIGGRLYHVMTDWKTYFGGNDLKPIDALKIWDGGLGIWGAIVLGGVGAWIGCKIQKIDIRDLADAIAPPLLLAQAIGRLGNYFNQELFGRATTMPWGLIIYDREYQGNISYALVNGSSTGNVHSIVHPTFLYELLWNLFFVVVLIFSERKYSMHKGQVFALYVIGYCFGRFYVELMRDDFASHILGLRVNTFTSAVLYFAALGWLLHSRHRDHENANTIGPRAGQAVTETSGKHQHDSATDTDNAQEEYSSPTSTRGVDAPSYSAANGPESPHNVDPTQSLAVVSGTSYTPVFPEAHTSTSPLHQPDTGDKVVTDWVDRTMPDHVLAGNDSVPENAVIQRTAVVELGNNTTIWGSVAQAHNQKLIENDPSYAAYKTAPPASDDNFIIEDFNQFADITDTQPIIRVEEDFLAEEKNNQNSPHKTDNFDSGKRKNPFAPPIYPPKKPPLR